MDNFLKEKANQYLRTTCIDYGDLSNKAEIQIKEAFIAGYEQKASEVILPVVKIDFCPKCGSNKLYTSTTGKLCCTKCTLG